MACLVWNQQERKKSRAIFKKVSLKESEIVLFEFDVYKWSFIFYFCFRVGGLQVVSMAYGPTFLDTHLSIHQRATIWNWGFWRDCARVKTDFSSLFIFYFMLPIHILLFFLLLATIFTVQFNHLLNNLMKIDEPIFFFFSQTQLCLVKIGLKFKFWSEEKKTKIPSTVGVTGWCVRFLLKIEETTITTIVDSPIIIDQFPNNYNKVNGSYILHLHISYISIFVLP